MTMKARIAMLATSLGCTLSALMIYATADRAVSTATVKYSARIAKDAANFNQTGTSYGNKRTGYPPCDSLQIVGLILMGTRSHRYGLPAFPRQLDRERLGDDPNSGESEAECIELIIYLFVVVC